MKFFAFIYNFRNKCLPFKYLPNKYKKRKKKTEREKKRKGRNETKKAFFMWEPKKKTKYGTQVNSIRRLESHVH